MSIGHRVVQGRYPLLPITFKLIGMNCVLLKFHALLIIDELGIIELI